MSPKFILITLVFIPKIYCKYHAPTNYSYNELSDHTMVTENGVFPYVVAILKKSSYISAGALIDDSWVLTAADALYLLRESIREIRVRLGSINFKKGGTLLPIKFFEIHPYFEDTKPEYDLALVKLPRPVQLNNNLNPIRLQRKIRPVTASHFIVTAWPSPALNREKNSEELQQLRSMEVINRRRILSVAHLHPSDSERCTEEMEGLDINNTETLMCLDPAIGTEPCTRDIGAPVVLNNILWAVISSYKPEDCELDSGPSFATKVAANDISSWIHATVRGHRWSHQQNRIFANDDEDYDENDLDDDDSS
ncbi:hypodermin-A-like isoform X2 [Hyposmocoma kahamanoa]|uniref:hypodermin-A-like isoform X2 n=1 Tax=Hyposmocoma kahamanoa TaxID=1477025 RepID=UPI000E6DA434|nr:hypodermin-A-like isoform X2 [Hyposmocoma kahamanoa]